MVIIGDAVAGANFELSEPLVRRQATVPELARS
jgi:uroporphyrin-III C-methyltransferase/precorrin-2 dehydrogenase/sirohydrochlorin ferrochelatase